MPRKSITSKITQKYGKKRLKLSIKQIKDVAKARIRQTKKSARRH